MSKRIEIRNAIITMLTDQITFESVIVPVYKQRKQALKNLPAIAIYTLGDVNNKTPDEQANRRTERVVIAHYIAGEEDPDETGKQPVSDELDGIINQTEAILNTQYQTLLGTVFKANYTGSQLTIDGKTEQTIEIGTTEYAAEYIEQL